MKRHLLVKATELMSSLLECQCASNGCQGNVPVVGEGHELLAKTNGVLALGDTVKVLESVLGNAL